MAARVVVFGELSPRTKVQYTRFLLDHDVQFTKRASDGKFVANIRLHGAGLALKPGSSVERERSGVGAPEKENIAAAAEESQCDARLSAIPTELRPFTNLIALIGTRAQAHSSAAFVKETRLVRLMNDIYDARHDDISSSDAYASAAPDEHDDATGNRQRSAASSNAFCRFIKHYLTNRFGLKKLVEQQAWELIDGLRSLQHRVDVELFVAFVDGRYHEATLLFTLFARATVLRTVSGVTYRPVLSKSASSERRTRKSTSSAAATAPAWLSRSQVESLAQSIFGSKTDDAFLEFMHAMKAFVLSQSPARTPSRLVEANELLFIAAETYQKSARASTVLPAAHNSQDVSTSHSLCGESPGRSLADSGVQDEMATTERFARSFQRVSGLPPPPIRTQTVREEPRIRSDDEAAKEPAVRSAVVVTGGGDVQQRLGSLLMRMQMRQTQAGE